MTKLEEKVCYVVLDGEAACLVNMSFRIVPFEVNASKLGTLPVFRYLIVFLNDLAYMVSMLFPHILDFEFIYGETELEGLS